MKRRKAVLTTIVIMVAIISIAAWLGRNSSVLKDIDTSDIEEITFLYSYEYTTLTEQEDIQILFEKLQSMKFKKILNYHQYGPSLLIDIKLKSGETKSLAILSNDIIINGQHFRPNKDYSESITNVFDTLSQK